MGRRQPLPKLDDQPSGNWHELREELVYLQGIEKFLNRMMNNGVTPVQAYKNVQKQIQDTKDDMNKLPHGNHRAY